MMNKKTKIFAALSILIILLIALIIVLIIKVNTKTASQSLAPQTISPPDNHVINSVTFNCRDNKNIQVVFLAIKSSLI